MTYEQCLRSTYFDLESWVIVNIQGTPSFLV